MGARLTAWVLVGILASVCAAAPRTEQRQAEAPLVTVEALASSPDQYLGKTVRVKGTLENQGTNYFTDMRLVLKDAEGHFVHVRPWLPFETPPAAPNAPGRRPDTLSRYLGKTVELLAAVDRDTVRRLGEVHLLVVESAKVVEDPSRDDALR
jgi:hypothetical protein